MTNPALFNPHLPGGPFFWEGGPIGALLIHGFTATSAEMRPFARFLLARGFTVAGPLLAGHGSTPDDLNRTLWTAWVKSAEEAYQKLQAHCQRIFVVGESAGAVVALALAIQHPEIDLLVLASPAIKLNLKSIQVLQLHLLAPLLTSVSKGPMGSTTNWQGYTVNPLKATLQLLEMEKFVLERMPLIRQPIQIIEGRYDKTIDLRSGEIILNKVCSQVKELVWMEESGHCVLLGQEMEQVFEKALGFISCFYNAQPAFRPGGRQPAQG